MTRPRRGSAGKLLVVIALTVVLCAGGGCAPSRTEAVGTTLNVRSYGAVGNGRTDDTAAFVSAMRAAVRGGATLYVPRGTFRLRRVTIPDGLRMTGADAKSSWLRGGIVFGSNQRLRRLRLGKIGYSTQNGRNASNTVFEQCRFRGGGGSAGSIDAPVIQLGFRYSVNHITFKDCLVERNLGTEDASRSRCYNNITLMEVAAVNHPHVDSITFHGCHIGVSNGRTNIRRNIGSPRAGLEAYTDPSAGSVAHGWSNINIIDCVFEATDSFCVDLADCPLAGTTARASGPARVAGCTLKGGGWGGGIYGYTLAIESPKGVIIENNTIYRGRDNTIGCGSSSGLGGGYIIRNNTFDLAYNNGITPDPPSDYHAMVNLKGDGGSFTDNTITTNAGGLVLELQDFSNGTVSGNLLRELRTSNAPWALNVWNAARNTITGNTFETAASTDPVIHYQGTNSNNTLANNIFRHN